MTDEKLLESLEKSENLNAMKRNFGSKSAHIFKVQSNYKKTQIDRKDYFKDALVYAYKEVEKTSKLPQVSRGADLAEVASNILENCGTDEFNVFATHILDFCKDKLNNKFNNVEIFFNVPEDYLRNQIAKTCRYAMKLDHKGMAENASSIVSCMGLYLPIVTMQNYLTPNTFCKDGKYEKALVYLSDEKYTFHDEYGEIRPIELKPEEVIDFLKTESDEQYKLRLECLYKIYEEGIFKSFTLAKNIEKLILEITKVDYSYDDSLKHKK